MLLSVQRNTVFPVEKIHAVFTHSTESRIISLVVTQTPKSITSGVHKSQTPARPGD